MTTETVRVAVVSPQPIVAAGLVSLLNRHEPRIEVVDYPGDPAGFEQPDPHVILYDVISLVEGDGDDLDFLVKMTASVVLAVGRDLRPDLVSQALNRGADGFFSIGASEQELLDAVESAVTGWEPGDGGENPTVGSSASAARANQLGTNVGLTEREAQIIGLIAQGLSNEDIASRLYLSVNSVKTYIRTTYRKAGVKSRSQAVSWAIEHG